jgi:hypothetical protein
MTTDGRTDRALISAGPAVRGRRRVLALGRGSRAWRRMVLAAALAVAALACTSSPASAYTYDYNFQLYDESWGSRWVAHNYHYLTMSSGSGTLYLCIKLVRTSNGANYGDVYCNYYGTGHHYAGDTGTYTFERYDSPYNLSPATFPVHEEW